MNNPKKKMDDREKKLTPLQHHVMREKGTERPFTGKYYDHKDKGMYVCAMCGNELFSSGTKFDSGTGWPSFSAPAEHGNVEETQDHSVGMERTEVTCSRCGSHLGHVFDDGPGPKGLRYCINSCVLDFESEDKKE